MRPTMIMRQAQPVAAAVPKTPLIVPALVFGTAGVAVFYYVRGQLSNRASSFDKMFSQYNSNESEANRARAFAGAREDPRTSAFNVLGWKW